MENRKKLEQEFDVLFRARMDLLKKEKREGALNKEDVKLYNKICKGINRAADRLYKYNKKEERREKIKEDLKYFGLRYIALGLSTLSLIASIILLVIESTR